ncbi:putative pyruvate dehydrogenase (lipoamide) kinase [Trypanosoma conorhini]|uniref:Protein-serine/threonine kinase n=1 Tax=Trypanosoma conorhini TaxID=83891 RepID=A0A3R7MEA7_9TRYP|nr:putative pyruvate dehydrogenase (lipoamide) kinase [Trypanosoma conorhini]RNF04223.1 putative pyruvate dehydrogenase (lipoamide) kinase [Trypanosoma conorhini]
MFRRCLLFTTPQLRDLIHRLDYFEKELIELKAFRQVVEAASPDLAAAAEVLARERRKFREDLDVVVDNPLTAEEFVELNQFYAVQKEKRLPLVNMMHIRNIEDLYAYAKIIHREKLVRLAQRARALNHAPMGLSQMPSIQELRRWYEWSFHGIKSTKLPVDLESAREFDAMVRCIFLRHYNVSALLSEGMYELGRREMWSERDFSDKTLAPALEEIQSFFDDFCGGRVRLRFLVGHYMYLSTHILHVEDKDVEKLTRPLFFDHDPSSFVGMICRECSLAAVVKCAIRAATELYDESNIELRIAGDPNLTFVGIPYVMYDVLSAMIDDAIQANVMRQEKYGVACTPVVVTISQRDENEQICVRVSDTAGGMPLEEVRHALKYWSAFKATEHEKKVCKTWIHSPIRMPYAYCAARAIGGDISVVSIEAYGTDRILYIPRSGLKDISI